MMGSLTPTVARGPGSGAMARGPPLLSEADGAARPTGFTDSAGDGLGAAELEPALALSSMAAAPGPVGSAVALAGAPGAELHAPVAIAQHKPAAESRRGKHPFLQK